MAIRDSAMSSPSGATRLTPRELEVLTLVSQGRTAAQIGGLLGIAKRTAEEHIASAVEKFGAFNRTHAVALAIKRQII
jgi:LuxR family transcriptional regulator, quorum-sensing system regulator BjaR1